MTSRTSFALLLLSIAPAYAATQYYATDRLTTIDTNKWTVAGKFVVGSSGISAPDPNGGTLVSRIPVPDGSSEAEVAMTLTLTASGGTYTAFLGATNDARTAALGSGDYVAFEMQNPKFDSAGNCLANFLVLQSVRGIVTAMASFQHACRSGMEMRLATQKGTLLVWPDQPTPIELYTTFNAGQPGVGAYGTPSGNTISLVQLGSIGRTALPAINNNLITASTFRNRVDVQWPAVPVAANSAGLNGYWIYRDGNYLMRTTHNSFSDESVAPGSKHTYTIYVIDQHFNPSAGASITVSTPVAAQKIGAPPPAVAPKH